MQRLYTSLRAFRYDPSREVRFQKHPVVTGFGYY